MFSALNDVRRMNSSASSESPAAGAFDRKDCVNALIACFLGWTLDAFDFFVLIFAISEIASEFHKTIPQVMLTVTITLAFRPVGALIFGLMADRYGRRTPLMVNLVFYSVLEVLSGLAPDYTTFLVLRALFGIGMGGEWGVGASLVMEKVPPRWRGVLSGLLQEGYAVGYLLAACCYFIVFPRWGWRPMFFVGGLPALLALFVRYRVKESSVWQKTRQKNWSGLGRAIVSNWKLFLYLTVLMMALNLSSHGTQDLYPTFLKEQRGFSPRQAATIAIIYNFGAIAGGILFGSFSDRVGRRLGMGTAFALAMLLVPLWAYAPGTVWLVVGAFLMQFMVQGAWGIIPAHITELSPDTVRGFLPGFAYQCGVLLASGVPYIASLVARHYNYATAMAMIAWVVFAFGIIVVAIGRERRGAQFGLNTVT